MTGAAAARPIPLGRPLDPDISHAILDSALHVLAEKGYGSLTVGEVARRAGVHKPAVYRRWGSRLDLVVAAINTLVADTRDPQTGDVRSDLVQILVAYSGTSRKKLDLALRLPAELAAEPVLAAAVEARIVAPRRAVVLGVIERAIECGQLRAETDPDLLIEILFGPLQVRAARGMTLSRRDAEAVVDVVLRGRGAHRCGGA
jgi:AcrR family transcriptional regulator